MIWSLVLLPCRNPACSSAISVSVFTRILSSMIRRTILFDKSNCFVICTFLGSGMNVENVHSSGHSPVYQIATHILCILSSTVSPALNSSAGTSSGPVTLRLAVWRLARATCIRSGGGSCSQYSCSIPLPFSVAYTNFMLITTKLFNDSVAVIERRPSFRMCTASLIHLVPLSYSLSRIVDSNQLVRLHGCHVMSV